MSPVNKLGATPADESARITWSIIDDALNYAPLIEAAAKNSSNIRYDIMGALRGYGDAGRERFRCFSVKIGAGDDVDTYWSVNRNQTDASQILQLAGAVGWKRPVAAPAAPAPGPVKPPKPAKPAKPATTVTPGTAVTKPTATEVSVLLAADDMFQQLNGRYISNVTNATVALNRCPEILLAYDAFKYKVLIQLPTDAALRELDEKAGDLTAAQITLQRAGLVHISKEATRDAICLYAHKNTVDSVADWLRSLTWDGTRRLSTLMQRGFGTEADRYHIRAGRNLILSMVARALRPGCKNDIAVIFEGPQGALKSSALRIIGGAEGFAELTANPNSKDFEQQMIGVWLGEFAEMNTVRRPEDIQRVKAFISNDKDHFRAPYARDFATYPRRTVLCGSTNEECWIHDPTGGRRFIPIVVGTIDLKWLSENREQLFAEAVALYKAGRKWWFYPKERAREEQAARTSQDPWTTKIRRYLCGRSEIIDLSALLDYLDVPTERQTQAQLTRVGTTLRQLGCVTKQRRVNGARERYRAVPHELANRPMYDATREMMTAGVRTIDPTPDFSDLL